MSYNKVKSTNLPAWMIISEKIVPQDVKLGRAVVFAEAVFIFSSLLTIFAFITSLVL